MERHIQKMRDFYDHKPGADFVQQEFGFYALERWTEEGHITPDTDLNVLFGFDPPATVILGGLGWCEAAFHPYFEEEVVEARGDYELVRDFAGRIVQFYKGRRNGYMPTYVEHPVKDWKTWEEDIKWRLDPHAPGRMEALQGTIQEAVRHQNDGTVLTQWLIGGYMYLRALMGPEDVMYQFFDNPELVHDCMQTWLTLADAVIAEHQKYVSLDEVFMAEDIAYNTGALISPDMMKEFLLPYYQQLLTNVRARQMDKSKKLHIQVDSDGNVNDLIDVYIEGIGMNYMSPFEVAAHSDVVEVRKRYPELLIRGGFDKRILAAGKEAIDREIARVMPFMKTHGGYIPSCDHGVPAEVNFEDYLYFRRRMQEF